MLTAAPTAAPSLAATVRLALCSLCLAVLAGCHSASNNRPPEAANIDTDSLAEAPTPQIEPQTYIAAGDLAAARQQYAQAAGQYGKALEQLPKDGPTIKKMGICQVKAGDLPGAIVTFQRYVATDGSADAYGSLGYAYELAKKPGDAEATYQEGIQKNPQGKLVRINYGLMLVRHARVQEAVTQLSAVLQPQEVNYDIAGVYDQMGRKDLAQFYYRKALECDPGFAPARQKLSMVDSK